MIRKLILAVLVIGCFVGSLIWYITRSPADADASGQTTTKMLHGPVPDANGSRAHGTAGTSPRINSNASGNPRATMGSTANGEALPADGPDSTGSTASGQTGTASDQANPANDTADANLAAPTGQAKGVQFATGPANGVAQINEAMQLPTNTINLGDPSSLKLSAPLPVYSLLYTDVANGASLEDAKPSDGSRPTPTYYYIITDASGNVVAMAVFSDIDASPPGTFPPQVDLTKFTLGDYVHVVTSAQQSYVSNIAAAINQILSNPQINAGSYEPRLLTIGGFNLDNGKVTLGGVPQHLVWLKSLTGGTDLIYPFGTPLPPGLVAGQFYTASQFLGVVQPLAQVMVAQARGGAQ